MNDKIAIEVNNLSKKYKIYQDKPVSLKERFLYTNKSTYQEKWVLQDISLKIPSGKMIGLIGRNGSGKSTLLKVLTRILKPDKGEVIIKGRVSSLLELGAGFHMDFTGRENIYMNASIFGLSRKEIDARLNSIVKFSELEAYIDNPVRTYSSGMFMRLAFSIAIHVDPDVLLIDEILAVGDNAFQRKCISKIEDFKRQGKTIVFVSHDNMTMEKLCDEVYWIDDSKVKRHGNPIEVIAEYFDFLSQIEEQRFRKESKEEVTQLEEQEPALKQELNQDEDKRWGNRMIEIKNVSILNPVNDNKFVLEKGQPIAIEISYEAIETNNIKPVFGFGVFKMDGIRCYGSNTFVDKIKFSFERKGKVVCKINSLNLVQGDYYLNVACHHEDGTPYDHLAKVITFSVHSNVADLGIAYLPHSWEFTEGE